MTKFMVQWEDHPSHLATRLGHLLEHQTLVDVTLMCNTHTLRVHRAVLAAGSPYFETILSRQLGQHPLIVLKDMQFTVLKSLIEFMYCGETSVTEDNLPALLQAAKFFQVRGLSSMTKEALGLSDVPNPSVSVSGDGAAHKQTTKRVNIQSMKPKTTPGEQQHRGVTFHTVAKTIPSKLRNANPADNAHLLLALADSTPAGRGPQSTRTTAVIRAGARTTAATPPAVAAPSLQSKPLFNRNYRTKDTATVAQKNVNTANANKAPRSRYSRGGGRKSAPCYAPLAQAPVAAPEQSVAVPVGGVLYQDPETNIIYQLEEPAEEVQPEQPEAPAEEDEEGVIYQLADGTITDRHGNPILDKDGNSQNIADYQHVPVEQEEEAEAAQEGAAQEADPYNMPILLDNGEGGYTAAVATEGGGDVGMSVEQALEEMMGDSSSATEDGASVTEGQEYSAGHTSILEETLRGKYPRQQADASKLSEAYKPSDEEAEETEFVTDTAQHSAYVEEGAEYVTEETEASSFVEEHGENGSEFITDGDEGAVYTTEDGSTVETEAGEDVEYANESEEGAESSDFTTGSVENTEFITDGTENLEFATQGTELASGEIGTSGEVELEEVDGVLKEKCEVSGSNGVCEETEGKIVELGSSSLLKNALQKSGIDLDSLGTQFTDIKPAVTYQISQVDGKQNVRLVNVGNDSTVLSPPKEALALGENSAKGGQKRRASSDDKSSSKRILLDEGVGND